MNYIISKYSKRIFNKLFLHFEKIKRVDNNKFNLNLTKPITRIYYSNNQDFWYSKGENEEKHLFIFGLMNKNIEEIDENDISLIIDFDKNNLINNDSIGLFHVENPKLHILINSKLLNEKYTINDDSFETIKLDSINNPLIDLGSINNEFIPNLEKLIKSLSPKENKPIRSIIPQMNLFLNSIERGNSYEKSLNISKTNHNIIKKWYNLGKNGNEDYKFFYEKYEKIRIKDTETLKQMEIFLSFLEKHEKDNALKLAGIDKKTLNKWIEDAENNEIDYIDFYKEYLKQEAKEKEKINEFITLINKGKTNKKAFESMNIPETKAKEWIEKGKNGDEKYDEFYKAYSKKFTQKERKCNLCGRSLKPNNKEDICKICLRKQYACTIVQKLLHSIKPEAEFGKEDLKRLNLDDLQIRDYIWTLQEFSLIQSKNNRYFLKNKETLNNFAKDSGVKPLSYEIENNKLNKTCKTCNKTLEISRFFKRDNGTYEDNCKSCKKLITTASYLKEIIEYVDFESEFREKDLEKYFENKITLKGKIWSLLDHDLIKNKGDTYILTDKKTAEDFLNKYGEKENDNNIPQIKAENENNTIKNMNTILKALANGKTEQEAIKKLKIGKYNYKYWLNEGKQENNGIYTQFYKYVNELKSKNRKTNTTKPENNIQNEQMKKFIEELKKGKTKKEAAKLASMELNTIYGWYLKGKENEEPYDKFYKEYKKVKNDIEKIKQDMTTILKALSDGESEQNAVNKSKITYDKYLHWLNQGKQENNGIYTQFYNNINKILPSTNTKEKEIGIYAPLPKEYEDSFKSSPTNKSGIAWVNQAGHKWIYSKRVKGKTITIKGDTVYELYKKVKNENQIWGIRNYNKAKKIINIPPDFKIPKTNNKSKIQDENELNNKQSILHEHISVYINNKTVIIKGIVKKRDLFKEIYKLRQFENNFKRIITNTQNDNVDIFIELYLDDAALFKRKIREFDWQLINQ